MLSYAPSPAQRDQVLRLLLAEQRRRRLKAAELRRIQEEAERIREKCRSLVGFIEEAWPILEPMTKYVHGWHHDAIAAHLEAITSGQITRMQINEPPGCMKSLVASVMWEAWEWGPAGLPGLRYLTTSYTEAYARRDSRRHRDLVMSDWYQTLWPHVKLVRDNETDFENTARGGRRAMPFASLTGGRGNRVVVDDPHSVDGAESEADRYRAILRFRESVTSRLNDPKRDAILVIMHRLHTQDICGEIERLGLDYTKLVLPMEYDPAVITPTRWFRDPRTEKGELLCPDRIPREVLEKDKIALGSHAYACQYQQTPSAREGGMFKRHWFKVVDALPSNISKRVRKWDLAASIPEHGSDPDWTAGVKMSMDTDGHYYVEDVTRFRELGGTVRSALHTIAGQDGRHCHIVVPQDPGQAGKDQAALMIRMLAGFVVKAIRETGSKETRAEPFAAQCEAGNVYLLRASWNETFIDEMCMFPQGHDDQFDAAAGAFNYLALKQRSFMPTEKFKARLNEVRPYGESRFSNF